MMTLKEIKTLQEMGFTLEEIKKEYYEETVRAVDDKSAEDKRDQGTAPATATEETEVKKNIGSEESLTSLKDEISDIKKLIYDKYSRENKENKTAKTDDLQSAFNSIINKEGI